MHVHARNSTKRARTRLCNYACAHAWIDLNFFLVVGSWVDILIFKFEKNPFSGCGEINVLLIRGPIQGDKKKCQLSFKAASYMFQFFLS